MLLRYCHHYILDIRFSIRYLAKSGHFSAIRIPAGMTIKNRLSGFRISGRISVKLDINKTFLLLFEDLRCFNYLSNYVEYRTDIEISGIRLHFLPDIQYPAYQISSHSQNLIPDISMPVHCSTELLK